METIVDSGFVLSVYDILGIVLASVLGGGALGVGLVGIIAKNILNNEAGIKAVEQLGNSVPREHADKVLEVVASLRPALDLAEEAFDGIPASDKAPQA